jgi:hypothetical protein
MRAGESLVPVRERREGAVLEPPLQPPLQPPRQPPRTGLGEGDGNLAGASGRRRRCGGAGVDAEQQNIPV